MNQYYSILLFLLLFVFHNSIAQSGSNDPTFSPLNTINGMADGPNNVTYGTAVQSDGKIIVVGGFSSYNGVFSPGIVRLNPDGTVDTSFHVGTGLNQGSLKFAIIQPDGKIVVAGGSFSSYNGNIAKGVFRINSNGTFDPSFNSLNEPTSGTGGFGIIWGMAHQSNGKIIIVGDFGKINGTFKNNIARLNTNGTIDGTFLNTGTDEYINAVAVFPNDKILIGGIFGTSNGAAKNGFTCLNSNGSNDGTFGGGGVSGDVECIRILPNNKIMIGGSFFHYGVTPISYIARVNSNGSLDNTFNPGTSFNTFPTWIDVLSDGKVMVGGYFSSFNSNPVGRICRINTDGTLDLTFNSGTGLNNIVNSIRVDSNDKVLVPGFFTGYNGILVPKLIRLNSNGSLDFTFNPSSGTNATIYTSEILSNGKIMIGGDFTGYNGILQNKIARLETDGVIDTTFHSGSGMNLSVKAITVQSDDKLIVGGDFTTYSGVTVNRLVRLSTNGTLDSSYVSFTGANKSVNTLVCQTDNKVILGGDFTSYNGSVTNRIARVNTDGSIDNSFSVGSGFDTTVSSIVLQLDGKLIVAGRFNSYNGSSVNKILRLNGNGTVDGSFVTGVGPNGNIRVLKLQLDGKLLVGGDFTSYNSTALQRIVRLNSDGSIDGTFNPGAGFDGSVGAISLQTDGKILVGGDFTMYGGATNKYLVRLNTDGSIDSVFETGSAPNLSVNSINIQADDKIIIAGSFTNYNDIQRNRIARLRVCEPEVSEQIQSTCDPYFWSLTGQTYNTSGIYTHVVSEALSNGCDSIYKLNLTIYPSLGPIQTMSSCESYFWPQTGQTYLASGQYTDTLINIHGCDSIIILNLTITQPNTGTDIQTACDSMTWIDGNTYTSSTNTPTFVLQNTAGCDSTVTLDLTVNHSNSGTDIQTACDSMTWIDGNTYYSSTSMPTFVLQNANGCDSTVTLNLTVNHSNSGTDIQMACDSMTWIDGNTYYSSTSMPTFVLQNADGCDSTVTLNLIVNHSNSGTDIQMACDSMTWIDGNTYYSSTSMPTFVLQNANGCDSTVTLDLTINHSNSGTDIQMACDSMTWIDGNTYYSSTSMPTFVLQNADGCDSTVTLDLTINHSNSGTDIQMACDSMTWIDGNTYYSSTSMPTFVLQNADGCDSTVTLNLTINHSNSGTDIQMACDSMTWIDGNTYYSSTSMPTFVLQNANGCDSTVTLDLTINHSNSGTDIQMACDSMTWIDGNTYYSSTSMPTFVLQNADGCDSTVTLDLTINHSNSGTDIQMACDSMTWIDGNTYYSSTSMPTFVLQNADGCDSTVTLDLTVNHSNSGTDIQTACDSMTWIDGNTYYSSTSMPTFVLQNANGCDSTVTLNLTIIPTLPLAVENVFVFPSDANTCVGESAITVSGNTDFDFDFDNGSQVLTSNGYSLVTNLCPGVHDLHVTSNCGDTLSVPIVIPVDSNYIFNNPFIDSLALDSLGVTMTNCDIFYNSIDTAYIDSIWTNGNMVNVIWNIVDSNGSNFDTTNYVLNNGNGVYWLQLSVFCPNKSLGKYFTVTEAIYFNNGTVSTAGLSHFKQALFEIYPNPTNDQVYISFSGSDAELTVYDLQGKTVLKDRIQNNGMVSLQNFERGVYLFDFSNSQGHTVQRVVKQ